jgi:hypothetical protein
LRGIGNRRVTLNKIDCSSMPLIIITSTINYYRWMPDALIVVI